MDNIKLLKLNNRVHSIATDVASTAKIAFLVAKFANSLDPHRKI
jgi:hypothetical protein